MPHECTDCGAIYEDGSERMLEGCTDCGGTTFLFTKGEPAADPASDSAAEHGSPDAEGVPADAPGSAGDGPGSAEEDPAQSRARDAIIDAEEDAVAAPEPTADDGGTPSVSRGDPGDTEVPGRDTDEIREALMAQFESIKIVEPGSYELNLMNLYDRDEKIIALQEDGRYQVSLPTALDE